MSDTRSVKITTEFGSVYTSSTRRYVVAAEQSGQVRIIARSDTWATLDTRLRREGWLGVFGRHGQFVKEGCYAEIVEVVR